MGSTPPPPPENVPVLAGPIDYYQSEAAPPVPAEWTNVEILALRPEELAPFIRLMLGIRIGFSLLVNAAVILLYYFLNPNLRREYFLVFCAIMGIIAVVSGAVRVYRASGQYKKTWRHYRLVLADQGVVVCDPHHQPVRIDRGTVRRIVETWDGFRLEVGSYKSILPKRIDSLDLLRERLSQWRPIEQGKGLIGLIASIGGWFLLTLAHSAIFFVGLVTRDKSIAIACLVVTSLLAVFLIWRGMRNRAVPFSRRLLALLNLFAPAYLILRLTMWW